MKKIAIITILAIVSLVILYQSGIIDALAYFVLVGVIPGTKYAIPSTFMLLLMTSAAWVLLFYLLPVDLLKSTVARKKDQPKRNLPKRRYERI